MHQDPIPTTLPELLAPAGNYAIALTAFDAGADAVYVSLASPNAEPHDPVFSFDELTRLLVHAHDRHRKVYVALDPLLKENEIPAIIKTLSRLSLIHPDAVIVRDLALSYLIRRFFPELKLHASTQMGIHNSAGCQLAADLGFQRVILERQVTVAELRRICRTTPLEIEIFVHGALCCSRSGRCLFSSWLDGHSSSRGKCRQPCRHRFFSPQGSGFFFSTNDLCSLDLVPQLKRLRIASLKIEGLQRQGAYIRNVVTAYRLMLDAPRRNEQSALREGHASLNAVIGRATTPGFRSSHDFSSIIQSQQPGVAGRIIGKVTTVLPDGFQIRLTQALSVGDKIKVQPLSDVPGTSFEVTHMRVRQQPVSRAQRGSTCFIPYNRKILPRSRIFLIAHRGVRSNRQPENQKQKHTPASPSTPIEQLEKKANALARDCLKKLAVLPSLTIPTQGRLTAPVVWLRDGQQTPLAGARVARSIFDPVKPGEEAVLPEFCPEYRLEACRQTVKMLIHQGIRSFRATSLCGLQILRDFHQETIRISTSFPLPVTNRIAIRQLQELGVSRIGLWPGLNQDAQTSLLAHVPPEILEIYAYGRLPILSTRGALLPSGPLRDDQGRRYTIIRENELSLLLPERPLRISPPPGVSRFLDLTHARWREPATTSFNQDRDWA